MRYSIALAALIGLSTTVQADNLSRPDAHAPIGVMGDHTHQKGEIMLSYRAMDMKMAGNRTGNNRVSQASLYADGFLIAPLSMDMTMHMLGIMYAPSDQLTLMAMLPTVSVTMDHQVNPNASLPNGMPLPIAGREFTTDATGLGDLKVGGLYSLSKTAESNLIANFTLSLPTGSFNERDVLANPMLGELQMPYPMQLGSGTYDIMPGLTYTKLEDHFSWGSQVNATLRLGENDNDYTLGDRFSLSSWIAKPVHKNISISARISHDNWQDIDGADRKLTVTPAMIPTADTELRGGKRTDFGIGVNLIFKGRNASSHRIALEFARPIHQDLDGPQLETDQILTVGYQIAL